MPEISVVIPVYNVEKYLRECLDSVRAQTFSDFEVVCIDDGSTDSSAAILQQYAEKDSRFRVITQKKSGLSRTRDAGAAVATGKYLYFLDSDDWIEPDLLKHCYEKAEQYRTEMLLFSHFAGYPVNCPDDPRFQQIYTGRDLLLLTGELKCWHPTIWVRFFRRDFYAGKELRFQPGIYYEDFYMTMASDLLAERAMFLPEKLYHYRRRENSICHSQISFQHFYSRWLCCKKLYDLFLRYIPRDNDLAELYSEWLKKNIRLLRNHYIDMPSPERDKAQENPEMAETLVLLDLILQNVLEIKNLYLENDILQGKLDFVLNHSISYKVGKAVTWLPQKIMQLLKGCKNG